MAETETIDNKNNISNSPTEPLGKYSKLYPNDQALSEYTINLIYRMDLTAGSRFQAAKRHYNKNRISLLSILVLALYAILFSLLATFDNNIALQHKQVLSIMTVFMSSFIIAFTIYEASKRHDYRSSRFLRSAHLINIKKDKLRSSFLSGRHNWKRCAKIERKYNYILEIYADNHSDIDFQIHRINKKKISGIKARQIKLLNFLTVWWLLLLSFISPILVVTLYLTALYLIEWALPS